jgi:hypothetical protein
LDSGLRDINEAEPKLVDPVSDFFVVITTMPWPQNWPRVFVLSGRAETIKPSIPSGRRPMRITPDRQG